LPLGPAQSVDRRIRRVRRGAGQPRAHPLAGLDGAHAGPRAAAAEVRRLTRPRPAGRAPHRPRPAPNLGIKRNHAPDGEPSGACSGRRDRKPDSVSDGHLSRPERPLRAPERSSFADDCPLPALKGAYLGLLGGGGCQRSTRAVAAATRSFALLTTPAHRKGRVRIRRLAPQSLAIDPNLLPLEPEAESGLSSGGPRAASDHPSHLPCGAERPTYRNDPHL